MMTSSKKPDKEISARVLIDPSGKMAGDSIPHLKNWLAAHANSYVDIVISELERTRNLSQNAYLHAIFAYFAEFIGDTPEHVKKRLKETWVPTGNIIVHAKGTPWEWEEIETEDTHSMSIERMSWFIDKVYMTMCEQGYIPPLPEQVILKKKKKIK
jgi:hypothetical protein